MTRNRHIKQRILTASVVLLMSSSLPTVSAQENQFEKADQLLQQIQSLTPDNSIDKLDNSPTPKLKPAAQVAPPASGAEHNTNADHSSQRVETPVPVAPKDNSSTLDVRLSEVPPNARFEFAQSLRIPAYKQGILFVNQSPAFSINNDADPLAEISRKENDEHACSLLSNRSYIEMRGSNNIEGKEPTFLSVKSVRFMRHNIEGQSFNTAQVDFKDKEVRGMPESTIEISVICRIPSDIKNPAADYQLKHFSDALGGLFNYRLPRYIEI